MTEERLRKRIATLEAAQKAADLHHIKMQVYLQKRIDRLESTNRSLCKTLEHLQDMNSELEDELIARIEPVPDCEPDQGGHVFGGPR